MNITARIYDSIHLNLGIKKHIMWTSQRIILFIDTYIIYPLYTKFRKILYSKIEYHYGADYRWGDERSQNLNKKQANLGYGQIHYEFVRNQKPNRILCIGSMYGFIPYMLARACQDNNFGHVDFVDAGFDMNDPKDAGKHIFGQGFWRQKNIKKHFSYLLDPKRISLHIMTTKNYAKKYPNRKYDYIYLDGDHRYKGAKFDFQTFWPRLREGGVMSLHDIHFDTTCGGIKFEQWKLWEKLVNKYTYKIEFYNHYSGLGFIQKRTEKPERFQGIVPE